MGNGQLVLVDRTADVHGPFPTEEAAWAYARELYPSDEAYGLARENADIYVACLVAPVIDRTAGCGYCGSTQGRSDDGLCLSCGGL